MKKELNNINKRSEKMSFTSGRQRRWFFANKPRLNIQRKLAPRIKIYGGINKKIGPYAGLVIKNSQGGSINPRTNLRYGPSVKAEQKFTKNTFAQGTFAPHKFDVNVKKRYNPGNYVSAGYESTSGPYIDTGNREIGVKYQIKKKKFSF